MTQKKDLDYYLSLPYRIVLYPAEEGGYVVEIPDLPGCLSQGETLEEALEMIQDAKKGWIETCLELGREVPAPGAAESFSGQLRVRMPKSLHKALSERAQEENVSLNQFIIYQLARGIGQKLQ